VITGLYGGIDWGPTDAWLTSDDRTVLICTYEKAEALIRFLGPLFLARLSLVVLDEAHMVQFDGSMENLRNAESRSLRLESLIARLFVHVPRFR
jgi:replicative superfamily II helicase